MNIETKVEAFIARSESWSEAFARLREISLACGLVEEMKWGKPCYMHEGSNIVLIQGFKESCALLFFKGVLLKDPSALLEAPGENSQVARRIPFTDASQVVKLKATIKAYIQEAIGIEKAGLKAETRAAAELAVPDELQAKFDEKPALKKAFQQLSPGRQRAYVLQISGAKQSSTRTARVEKYEAQILAGKGLNDS